MSVPGLRRIAHAGQNLPKIHVGPGFARYHDPIGYP